MNILVSNDDGIHAEGIYVLVEELKRAGHNVYVVAPFKEESGTGHGVTLHRPLRVKEIYEKDGTLFGNAVDGKPTDCVKLGYWGIYKDIKFDLVLSGINSGENLGNDVLYSGTVSAAAEGAMLGMKALAVSQLASKEKFDYNSAAKFVIEYIESIKDVEFPNDTLLNMNIPNIPYENIKGLKYTIQGNRRYTDNFIERMDPRGNKYYWLGGEAEEYEENPEADFIVVKDGYVSITPINLNLTDTKFLAELKKKGEKK